MNTAIVWVLLATSIDPIKVECIHVRVAAVFTTEAGCKTVETAERAPGTDTVWNCQKMQLRK